MPPVRTPILLMVQELTQGGSERQLTEIAKALDRERFEVRVGVLRPGGFRARELEAAGIPVACFPVTSFGSIKSLASARRMGKYLRQNRIRVVHSFDVPANVFAVPTARFYRTPCVISSQRAFRGLVRPHLRAALRVTDRMVDCVVVNCKALERHLVNDEGAPAGRIRLCYNGIDTTVFRLRPRVVPEPLRDASTIVGVVCALRPEKDLPTLVRAFAAARQDSPCMRLVIVGSGPVLPELKARAESLGIAGACFFVPATPNVTEWLAAIDIFVLPSTSEALSNSLMEAMACGCAAVASRVGGNPELVVDGERGLLFEAGDHAALAAHLRLLAAEHDVRRRLADCGQRFIHENFTIDCAARRMAEIYSEFLGSTAQ